MACLGCAVVFGLRSQGSLPGPVELTCCWWGSPLWWPASPHPNTQNLSAPPACLTPQESDASAKKNRQRRMAGVSARLCSAALNFVLHSQIVVTAGATPSCGHGGRRLSWFSCRNACTLALPAGWKQKVGTFSSQCEILSPDTNLVSFRALEAVICLQAHGHGVFSLSSSCMSVLLQQSRF